MSGNRASCSMRLLRKQLGCTLPSLILLRCAVAPPCPSSGSHFILFVVALSFRWSSWCSGLPVFGLLCSICCQTWKSNFSSWVVCHCIRLSPAEGRGMCVYLWRAANRNTHSLKWPFIGRNVPLTIFIFQSVNIEARRDAEVWCPLRIPELQYAERLLWNFCPMTPKLNCLPQL